MKAKPWAIKLVTICLLLVPLALLALLFLARSTGHATPLKAMELMWLFGVASVIVALSVWRVRLWGYIILFLFGFVIIIADTTQLVMQPKSLNVLYFVDFFLVAGAFFLMTKKGVREPYFNPKIRWWERPERHSVQFDSVISSNGSQVTAQILDISVSGCFVDMSTLPMGDETLKIDINHAGIQFQSDGRVVRVSEQPRGAGIMFLNLSRAERRKIKQIIASLKN